MYILRKGWYVDKEQQLTGTRERSVIPWSNNYKKYPNVLIGNWTLVIYKSSMYSEILSYLSSPPSKFLLKLTTKVKLYHFIVINAFIKSNQNLCGVHEIFKNFHFTMVLYTDLNFLMAQQNTVAQKTHFQYILLTNIIMLLQTK